MAIRIITVDREYGSGGGVVAQRLAQRLGWELVDHQIVVEIARELNISVEEAAAQDATSQDAATFSSGSGSYSGVFTFALANSWARADGSYTQTATYTLTAP